MAYLVTEKVGGRVSTIDGRFFVAYYVRRVAISTIDGRNVPFSWPIR